MCVCVSTADLACRNRFAFDPILPSGNTHASAAAQFLKGSSAPAAAEQTTNLPFICNLVPPLNGVREVSQLKCFCRSLQRNTSILNLKFEIPTPAQVDNRETLLPHLYQLRFQRYG